MFQSFDVVSNPSQGTGRVPLLRAELVEHGLDGFLIPRADEHQGEYVAERSERLQWLTGFTGSAGFAMVLRDRALIFVDGRYTLQASVQVDTELFAIESLVDMPPAKWLEENARPGMRIGFDPWLHTIADVRKLRKSLQKAGGELVAVDENLVDRIWHDQPAAPATPIAVHPLSIAGETAKEKIDRLGRQLKKDGASHVVLTDPSSLAWLFNIRATDVAHTPLPLGFAILPASGRPRVYLSGDRLAGEVGTYISDLADRREPDQLVEDLSALARDNATISLDPALAAKKLRILIEENGGTVVELADPARLPRAIKNEVELEGARAAHRRDGAAVVRFLHWLDQNAPSALDEIEAARTLEEYRRRTGEELQMKLRDISFDTISGSGPNGAIIHYRVNTQTNRKFSAGELYLFDSGGQYQDGTTDITRTVAIGEPDETMRRHYTIVLKGLIAISRLRFPPGTRGCDLDPFARHAHWQAGLDFAHGTGHGVGSYLAVHEGPQRLAKTGTHKLHAGMILSNEPGYYRPGQYGIRLENLIAVDEAQAIEGGDIAMHGFETLTLTPFDRRLILAGLLDAGERQWLDDYHARVSAEIGPLVEEEVRAWLDAVTRPLQA